MRIEELPFLTKIQETSLKIVDRVKGPSARTRRHALGAISQKEVLAYHDRQIKAAYTTVGLLEFHNINIASLSLEIQKQENKSFTEIREEMKEIAQEKVKNGKNKIT